MIASYGETCAEIFLINIKHFYSPNSQISFFFIQYTFLNENRICVILLLIYSLTLLDKHSFVTGGRYSNQMAMHEFN